MATVFGTDGVRGVAGEELTPDLALRLGAGAARFARESGVSSSPATPRTPSVPNTFAIPPGPGGVRY